MLKEHVGLEDSISSYYLPVVNLHWEPPSAKVVPELLTARTCQ
jgi:hypothetical protein